MPIDTTTTATSLVCPSCKKETGVTKEFILDAPLKDFYCPHCKQLVFSCKPEIQKWTYTGDWSGCGYD